MSNTAAWYSVSSPCSYALSPSISQTSVFLSPVNAAYASRTRSCAAPGSPESPSTQIRVGIFVFFTLVTFMAAIFLLGSRTQYFQPQYTLKAVFSNVGYLLEGAGVYLAGVQVGRVGEIRFFEDIAAQKVLVVLKVAHDYQERIRQDSVAVITSSGLLGDKYIDITLGSESEPELLNGMFIRTQEPADYGQLIRQDRDHQRLERPHQWLSVKPSPYGGG